MICKTQAAFFFYKNNINNQHVTAISKRDKSIYLFGVPFKSFEFVDLFMNIK